MRRLCGSLALFTLWLGLPLRIARAAPQDSVAFATLSDTAKVRAMNAEAWALRRTEGARAILLGQRSLALARRIPFPAGEAQILNYIGVAYQWLSDEKAASKYFFEALAVSDKYGIRKEKAYGLMNIASSLRNEGEAAQALTYAEQALRIQRELEDHRGIAYAHIRLAEIYNSLQRFDDAIV
ncbi:MAG: tetratricopeptide repeat protein, partial [Gemmatimonadaceae bacterium]|nr:tetratricopeptide repeat protein [Gemmatimonadaceae bacterium]